MKEPENYGWLMLAKTLGIIFYVLIALCTGVVLSALAVLVCLIAKMKKR